MPNADQIKKARTLLAITGNSDTEQKESIVRGFTGGRTVSISNMADDEFTAFVRHLETLVPNAEAANKMRRKIISMAHDLGWHKRDAKGNLILRDGKPVADMVRIDAWCINQGGKKLNGYTYEELPNIVTGFEKMQKSYF